MSGRGERVIDAMGEGGAARDDLVPEDEDMIDKPLELVEKLNVLRSHGLERWSREDKAWISQAYNHGRRKQNEPPSFHPEPIFPALQKSEDPVQPKIFASTAA